MNKFILYALILLSTSLSFAGITEQEFEQKHCNGNCKEQLFIDHDPQGPLSPVEQYSIQYYTETNRILDADIFIQATSKLPASTLIVYRGTKKAKTQIKNIGQVIELTRISSTSASRNVAENFVQDQLLIIKAKSARSIAAYSVANEEEFILLPGTRLRVNKIYKTKVDFIERIAEIEAVELTEL